MYRILRALADICRSGILSSTIIVIHTISPLAAKQREQLLPRHEGVCEIVNQDGLAWARERSQMVNNRAEVCRLCVGVCDVAVASMYFTQKWLIRSHTRVSCHTKQAQSPAAAPFILALEVLDNLPHDKASV